MTDNPVNTGDAPQGTSRPETQEMTPQMGAAEEMTPQMGAADMAEMTPETGARDAPPMTAPDMDEARGPDMDEARGRDMDEARGPQTAAPEMQQMRETSSGDGEQQEPSH